MTLTGSLPSMTPALPVEEHRKGKHRPESSYGDRRHSWLTAAGDVLEVRSEPWGIKELLVHSDGLVSRLFYVAQRTSSAACSLQDVGSRHSTKRRGTEDSEA